MQQPETIKHRYTKTLRFDYLLYLPEKYDDHSDQKWPLMLFLHGAGERGSDLEMVKTHGIPKVAESMALPFVCISPQCPTDHWWSDYLPLLVDLIDENTERHHIDPARVYLTGISMGGFGTWHLASTYPRRFTAIAPICGGGAWFYGFPNKVCALKDVPTWAFHGAKDPIVPVAESQRLVDTLKNCGGNVKFTIYPEAAHDSWTETYDNPELYEWFLCQKK